MALAFEMSSPAVGAEGTGLEWGVQGVCGVGAAGKGSACWRVRAQRAAGVVLLEFLFV